MTRISAATLAFKTLSKECRWLHVCLNVHACLHVHTYKQPHSQQRLLMHYPLLMRFSRAFANSVMIWRPRHTPSKTRPMITPHTTIPVGIYSASSTDLTLPFTHVMLTRPAQQSAFASSESNGACWLSKDSVCCRLVKATSFNSIGESDWICDLS